MPVSALRPRSSSEIVDASFQVYRTHFGPFVMCSAIAYLPVLVARILIVGDPRQFQTLDPSQAGPMLLTSLQSALVAMLSYALMTAVLTVCASQAYLGEEVDVSTAVRRALPRLVAVLVTTVIVSLLMVVGLILLFLPVLYVAARYFAVTPAILLEGRGILAALSRSGELSRGRKRHILNTLLLVGLIYFVIVIGLTIVGAMFGGFIVQSVLGAIATICLYPVIAITSVLLYYDARIQSEGLDIELMADALGPVGAPAVS